MNYVFKIYDVRIFEIIENNLYKSNSLQNNYELYY